MRNTWSHLRTDIIIIMIITNNNTLRRRIMMANLTHTSYLGFYLSYHGVGNVSAVLIISHFVGI